jgi:DNA-directed RNA polymerase alpha subunit
MSTEPIEIEKLEVSTRLKNRMRRRGVSDLRDIAGIPKESIFRIRNMGNATYKELQEQCDKYGIVIRSEKDVIDRSRGINGHGNNAVDSLKWELGALKI